MPQHLIDEATYTRTHVRLPQPPKLYASSHSHTPVVFSCYISAGMSFHHIREGVSRNLSLHYLSEGRVDEARSLMRTCLETCENNLRLDMPGGDESLELIEPLMLLSYVDMLAGKLQRVGRLTRASDGQSLEAFWERFVFQVRSPVHFK